MPLRTGSVLLLGSVDLPFQNVYQIGNQEEGEAADDPDTGYALQATVLDFQQGKAPYSAQAHRHMADNHAEAHQPAAKMYRYQFGQEQLEGRHAHRPTEHKTGKKQPHPPARKDFLRGRNEKEAHGHGAEGDQMAAIAPFQDIPGNGVADDPAYAALHTAESDLRGVKPVVGA